MFALLVLGTLLITDCARALELSPLFGHSMVLQKGPSTCVFGTSLPGDVISVSFNSSPRGTNASDASGAFRVCFSTAADATTSSSLLVTSSGGGGVQLNDVAVGSVFFLLGEGNAMLSAAGAFDAANLTASADALGATLRVAQLGCAFKSCGAPLPWARASGAVVGGGGAWGAFSALGFTFARALLAYTAASPLPVGVVVAAAGGSPLQAWAGPATLAACAPAPAFPRFAASDLFRALVAPLAGVASAGVLVALGESNANMAVSDANTAWVSCALPAFAAELRATLPAAGAFLGVVALPNLAAQFWTDAVPLMRVAQGALAGPTTAVVSAGDTGDLTSPFTWQYSRNKTVVGERLARAAATILFGATGLAWKGPYSPVASYVSSDNLKNTSTVRVAFDAASVGAGLSVDSTQMCPSALPEGDPNNLWLSYVCQFVRIRTDKSDGLKWYNADVVVSPSDPTALLVTAHLPRRGAAVPGVTSVQYAFAPWTASAIRDSSGNPALGFEIAVPPPPAAAAAAASAQRAAASAAGRLPAALPNGALWDKLFAHRRRGRALQSWLDLEPYAFAPLPLGTIRPSGWLLQQLKVQAAGQAGYLHEFYPPVAYSPWITNCSMPGGCQDTNGGEDFAYWFQGIVPNVLLIDPGCGSALCQQVASFIDTLLEGAATSKQCRGWIGPCSDPNDGNIEWSRWPVLFGLLMWHEATGDARILPALHAHLHVSYTYRTENAPISAWAGARWQDYAYFIQLMIDADSEDTYGEKQFLTSLMWVIAGQQEVVWEEWFEPEFFPKGNTPWNFSSHGVNTGEGLKSGAVLFRMTASPFARVSSSTRLDLLDLYHGTPTGSFLADETMSDSMPSHGTELCTVVESMLSLNVAHEILGDAHFADRAERVAYNDLPGTWTSDMWAHQYLHQPNAVNSLHQDNHVWLADGPDATTWGLAPNYPCCTANSPQGWPRFVQHMVHAAPAGGVAVSLLGPFSAIFNGVTVICDTEYPFGDDLTFTVSGNEGGMPFFVRIPGWATNATLTLNGGTPVAVGAANGTMYRLELPPAAAGGNTLVLATNPTIYLDSVGILYNGAVTVHRGALTYGMALGEFRNVTTRWPTPAPDHPILEDFTLNSTSPWNVAVVVNPREADLTPFFTFSRAGPYNASQPWDHGNPQLRITAKARQLPSWGLDRGAAAAPPPSPACAAPGSCGDPIDVTFVPYGMQHLRMSVLPWTPQ